MFDDIDKKQTAAAPVQPPTPPTTELKPEQTSARSAESASGGGEEIHTMPMEYYLGTKTAESTKGGKAAKSAVPVGGAAGTPSKKKILNIVIIAVLAAVVAGSAFLLIKSYEKPAPASPEVTTAPVATTTVPVKETEPVAAPVVEEKTPSAAAKFNPAEIKKFSLPLLAGPDADKDGLTDAEEVLLGTNANLNDSDGDVFKDKEEMTNFYSPVDKGKVRLWEKNFVQYYTNKNYGYKVLSPAAWIIQPIDESDPKDLMISSSQNEFVNIVVLDKEMTQTMEDWYLALAPEVKKADLKKYQTFNKLPVLESPDAFTVYVESAKKDKVFAINYNIGLKEEASFPAIFQMAVNSFQFVPIEAALPSKPALPSEDTGELPPGE